jgi:predicted DNA binding CopG/RHH family protein
MKESGVTSQHRRGAVMLEELKQKTFANEAEEAAWWEANEDALADEFEKAGEEGRLGHGTAMRRASQSEITICLDPEDIAKARLLAAKRGLLYEAYLRMIVHSALCNAEAEIGQKAVNF